MDFCILKTPQAETYGSSGQILTECHTMTVYNKTDVAAYINGLLLPACCSYEFTELPGCMYVDPLSLQFSATPSTGVVYVQRFIRTSQTKQI